MISPTFVKMVTFQSRHNSQPSDDLSGLERQIDLAIDQCDALERSPAYDAEQQSLKEKTIDVTEQRALDNALRYRLISDRKKGRG